MEFMIRTQNGDWFDFPDTCGPEVFLPLGLEASVMADSLVAKVKYEENIFSFSMEEPGIQVVLESGNITQEQAIEFIGAVIKTIESSTKQLCEYIHYA